MDKWGEGFRATFRDLGFIEHNHASIINLAYKKMLSLINSIISLDELVIESRHTPLHKEFIH